ncbi:MAG: fibronectin type III domain-containing protein, partial [Acidimicrobiales bacterium]|nr:fibronectin type III domain-containing protein [Acidimicrobiales bacterium]
MCYVDGPGTSVSRVCTNVSNEMRLDCNHDDYFSTAPPSGSYLDRNWNTADSRFLEDVPGTPQPPGPPQSVVATPGDHQVTLSWTKPTSDGGGPVLGYRVYRDGQPLPPVTTAPTTDGSDLVAGTSYTDTDAVNGVPHGYQVTAVNEIGESARSAVVSALAGVPRPDVQLATSRTGPFSFGDVFATSMTGNPQVLTRRAARGTAVTTFVRIENDRPGVDSFKVKGVGSGNGYTVRYLRGTTDVTAAVVAGTYTVTDVPAGGHVDLKMKVTIGTNAPRGSTRALTVTVKSKTVKTIKDVAQVRVKRA